MKKTRLDYAKEQIYRATIPQLRQFLLTEEKGWKKQDYVKAAMEKLSEDNVVDFMNICDVKMTANEIKDLTGISNYGIKKLVKTGHLHVAGEYKCQNTYGYGNLYSANEVFDNIHLMLPAKSRKPAADALAGMPGIMEYYPEARKLHRKFYIHVGGTNTGKTYSSLQALKQSRNGVYLGPLRLLAIEVFEQLNAEQYPCSLLTGEEEDIRTDALFEARTVEKADIHKHYECAIIDECQMLGDSDRGAGWTRAILGLCADEIHVITAPEGLKIVKQLIGLCYDEYEIISHERKIPLELEEHPFGEIKDHDALIVFSRRAVLALAADLEKSGIPVSIIYGSLPYSVRTKEAEKFRTGETKVVVSTDAIGMGLNLPIQRIVFMENRKFDGTSQRILNNGEVKQIAGRAGRFGMFDTGFVSGLNPFITNALRESLNSHAADVWQAAIPFPEELLKKKNTYGSLLKAWEKYASVPSPFVKKDVSREMKLNSYITSYHFDNETAYRLCGIPFDEKNDSLLFLWRELVRQMFLGRDINYLYPVPGDMGDDLLELETLYKEVDLYYSFCKTMNYEVELQRISADRDRISLQIMEILKTQKSKFVRRCKRCNQPLSWNAPYAYHDKCYKKMREERWDYDDFYDFW